MVADEQRDSGRSRPGAGAMPDRNTEYLYYQTLIGAWPLPIERAQATC